MASNKETKSNKTIIHSYDINQQNRLLVTNSVQKTIRGLLEHFNIFSSHLGRREDKAGKEENTTLLVVG